MPFPALTVPLLMMLAVAEDQPITVKGYPWAPFISPMGEPFRAQSTGEAPIASWFAQADRNRDGLLSADEMQLDADRFFARLDENEDGQIDREELVTYESVIAPDIQVHSNWRRTRGEAANEAKTPDQGGPREGRRRRGEDEHDGYRIDGLQAAARYGLLNMPQPVAGADADLNRAITRQEFRQAALYRIKLLDRQAQGRIKLAELAERLPTRPKGKRTKPSKDAVDTRVGLPLPEGN